MTPTCDYVDFDGERCGAEPAWLIAGDDDRYDIAYACPEHVGALLDEDREYHLYPIDADPEDPDE